MLCPFMVEPGPGIGVVGFHVFYSDSASAPDKGRRGTKATLGRLSLATSILKDFARSLCFYSRSGSAEVAVGTAALAE